MTLDVEFEENAMTLDANFEESESDFDAEFESVIKVGAVNPVGKSVKGEFFTPYVVDEENDCRYIYDEPVEAMEGAEVFNDYDGNIATGYMAQASGYQTQAIGNYSKAGGWWTRADGQCAVAEGLLCIASGHFTHAEGTRTKATINNAHSEGDMTQATGRQSHAEGQSTIASGFCSHAEGSATQATNYYSHAEGLGTIAAGKNQTVMGKYNVKDTTSLLIIGNGSKDTARSNAHKLDANGNAWYAGTVETTGIIMKSPNGTRFKITVDDDGQLITTKL